MYTVKKKFLKIVERVVFMRFEAMWKNICRFEGEEFKTARGIAYTYVVYKDYILINDDKRRKITKTELQRATLIENPLPAKLKKEGLWGPSYVFGIITDKRIDVL